MNCQYCQKPLPIKNFVWVQCPNCGSSPIRPTSSIQESSKGDTTSPREILMDLALSDFITPSRAIPRVDEALAALDAYYVGLIPEKFEPERDSMGDKYLTDTKDGWNRAIDIIHKNFKGEQTQ